MRRRMRRERRPSRLPTTHAAVGADAGECRRIDTVDEDEPGAGFGDDERARCRRSADAAACAAGWNDAW